MPNEQQRVEELRQSAQELAKQALETAELGLRLARGQFENVIRPGSGGATDVTRNLQDVTLTAETKAKEMFTLATNFMQELNEKWQPGRPGAAPQAEKPKPEKINIDVE